MNNRYLYRAKRTDNGEWAEGHLITDEQNREKHFIGYMFGTDDDEIPSDFDVVAVYQSTICQCTGLKDKHGKLIWENDVVEMYDRNADYRWRAVVTFGNPNGEYTWGWQLKPIVECEANTDILCWIDMEESGAFCKVIGSAIDNPELLE